MYIGAKARKTTNKLTLFLSLKGLFSERKFVVTKSDGLSFWQNTFYASSVAFVKVLLLGVTGCQISSSFSYGKPVTDVQQGKYKSYGESVGDTWDPAWAEDNNLYTASDDGSGWNNAANSNICFSRISGTDFQGLIGKTINPMKESGGWGAGNGPDGRTWKSSGCYCVDDILYLFIGRHMYGDVGKDPFRRQTAINSSIIKSTDHGVTWTPSFQECYDKPMFPSNRFATPYFIYYGKNGAAPQVDNADKYIYATSNNGFWNNGDRYYLGRIERSEIGNLDPSEWQFYVGGDGMLDDSWSNNPEAAATLIDNPGRCGMTGATYIPFLKRYILISWYYPRDMNVESNETRFIYFEAPHPWGPWASFHEEINNPAGWYSPRILAKWQFEKDDNVNAVIVAGGDFWEIPWFYKFTVIPVKFKTRGEFDIASNSPQIVIIKSAEAGNGMNQFRYFGSWKYIEHDKDLGLGEYRTNTEGDSLTIAFKGRRIRWYSCKGNASGIAKVSIDGGLDETLDLWTRWCPEILYNRLAFDSGELPPGDHTFVVKVTGKKNQQSIANSIYNEKVEIEK
jgi:hypothetical protein